MRVTTWAEYGLLVAVHLARRGQDAPVPARDVAERERLPVDFVEQILLRLRRAQLVESRRGARGGYVLARPPAKVSVREILEATENRTFEVNCDVRPLDEARCGVESECSVRPVWMELRNRVDAFLGGVSLADLVRPEAEVRELVQA